MKCAIIDDEPLALGLIESYVLKTPGLELAGKYANAVKAMSGLREEPVDLLFLDIQMPDLNGIELSRMIDNTHTRIVFTTAFSEYALEGYKVNAIDYLLKPISYPDFVAAVSRAQRWHESQAPAAWTGTTPTATPSTTTANDAENFFFVKSEYKIVKVNHADILYVEGLKDYVKIYLTSQPKPLLSLISMRSMEEMLPSDVFIRVHRSFIVNLQRVEVMEKGQIVFGDKYIPISESYKERVNDFVNRRLISGR